MSASVGRTTLTGHFARGAEDRRDRRRFKEPVHADLGSEHSGGRHPNHCMPSTSSEVDADPAAQPSRIQRGRWMPHSRENRYLLWSPSRPSSLFVANPSRSSTSQITRVGWRWLLTRCFVASQGQSWDSSARQGVPVRCAGFDLPSSTTPWPGSRPTRKERLLQKVRGAADFGRVLAFLRGRRSDWASSSRTLSDVRDGDRPGQRRRCGSTW
jgi:hypothetical protein